MKHCLGPKAEQAIQKVLRQFEQGNLSRVVDILRLERAKGDRPSDAWTFANRVLAYVATGSLDARGIRQWNEVGRKVKRVPLRDSSSSRYCEPSRNRTRKQGKKLNVRFPVWNRPKAQTLPFPTTPLGHCPP